MVVPAWPCSRSTAHLLRLADADVSHPDLIAVVHHGLDGLSSGQAQGVADTALHVDGRHPWLGQARLWREDMGE